MGNLSQKDSRQMKVLRGKKARAIPRKKAACLPCRQRRIRCLGQGLPCETCTTRGIEDECEFAPGTIADPDYIASHVLSEGIDGGGQPQIGNDLRDITDPPSSASTVTTLSEPGQNPSLKFSDPSEGAGAEPKISCVLFDQWPGQEISTDVDRLDSEWLTAKYTCLFASDTNEAHEALHELQQSYHQATPGFRTAVNLFFQTEFVHQLVVHEWRLFADYKDAIYHQDELQHEFEFPDIASWCARSCRGCFYFLLQQSAIRPWYFNSFGHSFFFLAFQVTDISTMRYLISHLSPMHLLGPASIQGQKTILQLAAGQPDIFSACLFRLEEWILDLRGALDLESFCIICRYATAHLADRMYMKGINTAHAVQNDASIWLEIILHHPDPAPLLDWLWGKGCLPPLFGHNQHPLLEFATQNDRLKAAQWLLSNANDPAEYRKCAMEAAGRQTEASVGIFECAMRWMSLVDELNDVSENAAFVIICSTCHYTRGLSLPERNFLESLSMRKVLSIATFFKVFFDESAVRYVQNANLPRLVYMLRSFRI